jgi:hypothetical protein
MKAAKNLNILGDPAEIRSGQFQNTIKWHLPLKQSCSVEAADKITAEEGEH